MNKNTKVSVAEANEAARKQKRNSIIITVCVIVAAVLVIGLAVYNFIGDDIKGMVLRNSTVAETENFEVNGAMLAYMYNANASSYSSYISMLGGDPSASLKTQLCPLVPGTEGTWYDYIMDATKRQVTELLVFAEGAIAAGITLTAEEMAEIDAAAATIEEEAASYGYPNVKTYILAMTGNNIKVSDIKDCFELNAIANKYYTHLIDTTVITAEDREAYYAENADSFNFIDVYKYNVLASDFEELDDEGNLVYNAAEQSEMAKKYAEELAAIEGIDAFAAAIRAEIDKVNEKRENETDEQFEERKEALYESAFGEFTPVSGLSTAVGEWAKAAEVGDTYVDGVEGATTYTVYMMAKTPYRNEEMSRDVRHILFSNEEFTDATKANEIYDQFVAAGATEEEFIRLAKEYSADTSAENGGLIENVTTGQTVEAFDAWLFDDERQSGDHGVVESDYGWHIMYYVGEGDLNTWEVAADSAIKNEKADTYLAEKGAAIVFDQAVIDKINA